MPKQRVHTDHRPTISAIQVSFASESVRVRVHPFPFHSQEVPHKAIISSQPFPPQSFAWSAATVAHEAL